MKNEAFLGLTCPVNFNTDSDELMDTSNVTRFEIIDHTPCEKCNGTGHYNTPTDSAAGQSISFYAMCDDCDGVGILGREVIFYDKNKQLDVELQDGGRTLKVFIHERYEE